MRPIVGIAALGSAVVQSTVRNRWIGWAADDLVAELGAKPSIVDAVWLEGLIDRLGGRGELRYERLETTLGFGSFQFTKRTTRLLIELQAVPA